jgi:hypothetical protein
VNLFYVDSQQPIVTFPGGSLIAAGGAFREIFPGSTLIGIGFPWCNGFYLLSREAEMPADGHTPALPRL